MPAGDQGGPVLSREGRGKQSGAALDQQVNLDIPEIHKHTAITAVIRA